MTMEDKKCPMFIDGEECGHPLIRVDLEAKKIARYDLASFLGNHDEIKALLRSGKYR
jgi:hypothetical protein